MTKQDIDREGLVVGAAHRPHQSGEQDLPKDTGDTAKTARSLRRIAEGYRRYPKAARSLRKTAEGYRRYPKAARSLRKTAEGYRRYPKAPEAPEASEGYNTCSEGGLKDVVWQKCEK